MKPMNDMINAHYMQVKNTRCSYNAFKITTLAKERKFPKQGEENNPRDSNIQNGGICEEVSLVSVVSVMSAFNFLLSRF